MPRHLLQAEQYLKGRISGTDLREMPSRRDYGLSCSMIHVRQMPFLNDTWSAMRLRLLDDPHVFDARTRILPFREDEVASRSEEHTSELQSQSNLVCRLLLEKKKTIN